MAEPPQSSRSPEIVDDAATGPSPGNGTSQGLPDDAETTPFSRVLQKIPFFGRGKLRDLISHICFEACTGQDNYQIGILEFAHTLEKATPSHAKSASLKLFIELKDLSAPELRELAKRLLHSPPFVDGDVKNEALEIAHEIRNRSDRSSHSRLSDTASNLMHRSPAQSPPPFPNNGRSRIPTTHPPGFHGHREAAGRSNAANPLPSRPMSAYNGARSLPGRYPGPDFFAAQAKAANPTQPEPDNRPPPRPATPVQAKAAAPAQPSVDGETQSANMQQADTELCVNCNCWYSISHNHHFACNYHPGEVSFAHADWLYSVPIAASKDGIDSRNIFTAEAYSWTCCKKRVGRSAGCVHRRHSRVARME